ncbi:MAG: Uncharacterised protein [Prochlorococcus marinus str. MIT 9215]|nr:MAG: Uncharacterised protein [Prochlorococcus marinus str. MIT 9215]
MHHCQSAIATFNARGNDSHSRHIKDLVESFLLALHLAPDAIKVLRTTTHFTAFKTSRHQAIVKLLHRGRQAILTLTALGYNLLLNLSKGLILQQFESHIFQLPLESSNPKTIG